MKTTIDIPEPLYKRAKIKAVERGESLRQIVLTALANELDKPEGETGVSFAGRRRLTEAFALHEKAGAYRAREGQPDITAMISEERDGG